MANPLCHFEFVTGNVERCEQFYASVFDWDFAPNPLPGYTLIRTGQDPSGGIMKAPPHAPRSAFIAYFMVDDIGATLKRIEQAGGRVNKEETALPHIGSFAVFTDPDGNLLGLFKPR